MAWDLLFIIEMLLNCAGGDILVLFSVYVLAIDFMRASANWEAAIDGIFTYAELVSLFYVNSRFVY